MLGCQRSTEKEPLPLLTVERLEKFKLFLIFNTFGDHSFAQTGTHGDYGADDDAFAISRTNVLHQ